METAGRAAAFAELLAVLPETHPRRARILQSYHTMMAALVKYQSDEGMWRQLIDRPDSWVETSATAMFAYAMVTGVKHRWLDHRRYGPAARRAWLSLVEHLDAKSNLREVCIGTNKANEVAGPDPDEQLKFYLERPRRTGDLHGQAPMMWTAAALLQQTRH